MERVLVDSSVWIAHFRDRNEQLVALLLADSVLSHPLVWGELACGTPPMRKRTLSDIQELARAQVASLDEVIRFVEREQLYGLGCGLIDLSLLASVILSPGARLWTLDRRLAGLAQRYRLAHLPISS